MIIDETKVTFCATVYNEFDLAKRLLNQIRSFYPKNEIIFITDGTYNEEFNQLCIEKNVKYFKGEHLFSREFRYQWLERILKTYLSESQNPYLIKIDTDCILTRKFQYFPNVDMAGSLIKDSISSFIQGGCRFQTRKSCEKVLESKLLEDPKYIKESIYGYKRFSAPYRMPWEKENDKVMIAEDRVISDIYERLNMLFFNWDEVYSRGWGKCPNPEKYAAIHPVKR